MAAMAAMAPTSKWWASGHPVRATRTWQQGTRQRRRARLSLPGHSRRSVRVSTCWRTRTPSCARALLPLRPYHRRTSMNKKRPVIVSMMYSTLWSRWQNVHYSSCLIYTSTVSIGGWLMKVLNYFIRMYFSVKIVSSHDVKYNWKKFLQFPQCSFQQQSQPRRVQRCASRTPRPLCTSETVLQLLWRTSPARTRLSAPTSRSAALIVSLGVCLYIHW